MARTIAAARQMVGHRHICVNKSVVSVPSYQCQLGDTVSARTTVEKSVYLCVTNFLARLAILSVTGNCRRPRDVFSCAEYFSRTLPRGLSFDKELFRRGGIGGRVTGIERQTTVPRLNELFVIEYYSRKI